MVKRNLLAFDVCKLGPFDACSVVPCLARAAYYYPDKGHRHDVLPRVALWIRIDAQNVYGLDFKRRLLLCFPLHRVLDSLAFVDKASRKGKLTLERVFLAHYHQNLRI